MRVHSYGWLTYYATIDEYEDDDSYGDDLEEHLEWVVSCFRRRKTFCELLDAHSKKTNLQGYILLQTHGGRKKDKWWFSDGKRDYILQNWINKNDGKALAILLQSCNEHNLEVRSEKSIIIHPIDKFNAVKLIQNKIRMRIYVPGEGYLDTQYKLRKTIDNLV